MTQRTPGDSAPRVLRVKVKPNARTSRLTGPGAGGLWQASLASPPVDGKANAELIALIAHHFGCRRADVAIRAGAAARIKTIRIRGG